MPFLLSPINSAPDAFPGSDHVHGRGWCMWASITSGPEQEVTTHAFDKDGNQRAHLGERDVVRACTGWGAVVRVDPVTGDRTIVSDAGTGAGPFFGFLAGIAVEADGDLVVTDQTLQAVLRVDPITGDRTIVSGAGTGAGPAYASPVGIAIKASGDYLVGDTLPRENVNTNLT